MFLRAKSTIPGCNEEWSTNQLRRSTKSPAAHPQSSDREPTPGANYRALPARLPGIFVFEARSAAANTLPFRDRHLAIPTGAPEEAFRRHAPMYAGKVYSSVTSNTAAR